MHSSAMIFGQLTALNTVEKEKKRKKTQNHVPVMHFYICKIWTVDPHTAPQVLLKKKKHKIMFGYAFLHM